MKPWELCPEKYEGPTGNAAFIVNTGDQLQAFQQAIARIEAAIPADEVHDVKIDMDRKTL